MPFATTQWTCTECNHHNVSVYEIGTPSLECGGCKRFIAPPNLVEKPLIIAVVAQNEATWIKINRECDRIKVLGLLTEAIGMLQSSDTRTFKPEDCDLRIFITIDDTQMLKED